MSNPIDKEKGIGEDTKSNKSTAKSTDQDRVSQVINLLKEFSVMEFLKLEENLKEQFGLGDLGSIMSSGAQNENSNESDNQSSVSLFVDDLGSLTRIEAMKLLNQALKMSVSEVKEALDSLPYKVLDNVTKEQAQGKIAEINSVKEGLVLTVR